MRGSESVSSHQNTQGFPLLPVAARGIPVSFLCNGQDIPDNILPADRESLASMILEGSACELQI